jgi:phosphoglycolate phosphatase
LIDISARHYSVYLRCVDKFHGEPLDKNTYWTEKRENTKWPELLRMSGIETEKESEFLKMFIELIEQPDILKQDLLFGKSKKVLEELRENNSIYLLSLRRSHANLIGQLNHLGIEPLFTQVLSGHSDTVEGSLLKKAEVISATGIPYYDAAIIGDTEADISAAKTLQIPIIAVSTGIRSKDYLEKLSPDYVVDSIDKTVPVLNRLRKGYSS